MNKGTIFQAIKQVIELYSLPIKIYSYNLHFDQLWQCCSDSKSNVQYTDGNEIWCVVDEGDDDFRWFQIGIWGRYIRASQPNPPKLLLLARNTDLYPESNEIVFPKDYIDSGIRTMSLTSATFLVDFLNAISDLTNEKVIKPSEDQIKKWKSNIRKELNSDEYRHHISNEVAPIIFRKTISNLEHKVNDSHKQFIQKAKKDLLFHTINNNEGNALLKIWEWINYIPIKTSSEDRIPKLTDIWDLWQKKARFILVDDQAKSHKYENIIRCALELTLNHEITLTDFLKFDEGKSTLCSVTSVCGEYDLSALVTKVQKNYDCLFLDLRLSDDDRTRTNYEALTGIVIAKKLCKLDPSFPIIIFTSSQKREIDAILSEHKNVIQFRKPGIAGSIKSLDGTEAFNKLMDAIERAIEMIEDRVIYKSIVEFEKKFKGAIRQLKSNIIDKKTRKIKNCAVSICFDDNFLVYLYDKYFTIFVDRDYRQGLSMPDDFLNDLFAKKYLGRFWNSVGLLPLDSYDHSRFLIIPTPANQVVKIISGNTIYFLSDFFLKSFTNKQTFNINLHYNVFCTLRDIVSHSQRNWSDYRREAIINYALFLDTLIDIWEERLTLDVDDLNYLNSVPMNLKKLSKGPDYYHVFGCAAESINDMKKYFAELFSTVCYYGNNQKYNLMVQYCKHYFSSLP